MDKHYAKTITYRILSILSEFVIFYVLTRHLFISVQYTIILNLVATGLYLGHEKFWHWYVRQPDSFFYEETSKKEIMKEFERYEPDLARQ